MIREVGPRGSFLAHPHTRDEMRRRRFSDADRAAGPDGPPRDPRRGRPRAGRRRSSREHHPEPLDDARRGSSNGSSAPPSASSRRAPPERPMQASVRVLSDDERALVHERALAILARTGVRVDTDRGRRILGAAGAEVDEVPPAGALPARARGGGPPARAADVRPGRAAARLEPAARRGRLLAGGRRRGAVRRGCATGTTGGPATHDDWLAATHLVDALEEVGVYWRMVAAGLAGEGSDAGRPPLARGLRPLLEARPGLGGDPGRGALAAGGAGDDLRRPGGRPPAPPVLVPAVPASRPSSWRARSRTPIWRRSAGTSRWRSMPMPLMGLSGPGRASRPRSCSATARSSRCSAWSRRPHPGTPFIYAPALAVMDPRSGRFGGGAVEHALLGAAATEMARYYGLPAQSSAGGTDHHVPGSQAGYERAINWVLPALSWPDLLVGPGLLGGSTVLSLEQLLVDVEVFRRCVRLRRGIGAAGRRSGGGRDRLRSGPAGRSWSGRRPATRSRAGEWLIDRLGVHDTYERWDETGRRDLLDEARRAGRGDAGRPSAAAARGWHRRGAGTDRGTRPRDDGRRHAGRRPRDGGRSHAGTGPRDGGGGNVRFDSRFLSDDEQARVHEESLRILAEVGVRFHGERALPLLGGGRRPGGPRERASPGSRAISWSGPSPAVPRSFVLGARNPVYDYPLPSPVTRYAIDGTASFVLDFETGDAALRDAPGHRGRAAGLPGDRPGGHGLGTGRARRTPRPARGPSTSSWAWPGPAPSTASTSSTRVAQVPYLAAGAGGAGGEQRGAPGPPPVLAHLLPGGPARRTTGRCSTRISSSAGSTCRS